MIRETTSTVPAEAQQPPTESSEFVARLLFASHQRLVGAAVIALWREHYPSAKVTAVNSGPPVLEAIGNRDLWDMILLDELFVRTTAGLLDRITHTRKRVPVALLADPFLTPRVDIFLRCGVSGVLNKEDDTEAFFHGCRAIIAGQPWMARPWHSGGGQRLPPTPRQLEVLALLAAGLSNKQIAARLGCAENTVKVHLRGIYRVLGVRTRVACLRVAAAEGWLPPPGQFDK